MKRFAALYRELDASTATREKQAALQRYFCDAPAADAAWAVYFLAGGKPRQTVPTRALRELAQVAAGLPEWLFEESYQTVGDLAETVSLLLPPASAPVERGLAEWLLQHLLPLRKLAPGQQAVALREQWDTLPDDQRFVYFKLITGGFRVGVSRLQVTQALAAVAGVESAGFSGFNDGLPLDGDGRSSGIMVEGKPAPVAAVSAPKEIQYVSPGFFETMRTPLLAGRTFDWNDVYQARRVALAARCQAEPRQRAGVPGGVGHVGQQRQGDERAQQRDAHQCAPGTTGTRTLTSPAAISCSVPAPSRRRSAPLAATPSARPSCSVSPRAPCTRTA
jgi:hypothetical protein